MLLLNFQLNFTILEKVFSTNINILPMLKYFIIVTLFISISACSKTENINPIGNSPTSPIINTPIVFSKKLLDSVSNINKTTSWYTTTIEMTELFDVNKSNYWGFELNSSGTFIPYNTGNSNTYSASKNYYWNDLGTYLFADFTGDGKKDLWAYYWKNPWPTNAPGLHLFSEYSTNSAAYNLQKGLTQVRKCVISDIDNDKKQDIVLFSSGFDGMPFPGDSLGIFYPRELKYQYLNKDIGYFHGGATGDINNDGLIDIVAYSGGSAIIPVHPTCYINKGNRKFELANSIFKNFNSNDNYYTVELYDINKDGALDLFLGSSKTLRVMLNENGTFDRSKAISFPIESNLELMDMLFMDFDQDGKTDVLTMSNVNYNGYALRLFINKGNEFIDNTKNYFDLTDEAGNGAWIKWIRLFDVDNDNDLDIVADGLFGDLKGNQGKLIYWKNNSGKFVRIKV